MEINSDIETTGYIDQKKISTPSSPDPDYIRLYTKTSGTSPNKIISYMLKYQDGTEIIFSTNII